MEELTNLIGAPLLMVLCGVLGAYREGLDDARTSIDNEPVEHKWSALFRVITAAFIAMCVVVTKGLPWWQIVPLALVGLAAFGMVFRYTMNKRRKFDWRYVSPSNWYDRLLMLLFVAPGVAMLDGHNWALYHRASYGKVERYTRDVHRSGLAGYIRELSILALSTWGYIHFTNI